MLVKPFSGRALGLCGIIFMIAPPVIPDELLRHMPIADVRSRLPSRPSRPS